MDTTHVWQMPSGSEVESAALLPPAHELSRSGWRGRLDTLKTTCRTKVHDLQHVMADRRTTLQTNAHSQMDKVQDSMRTSPMKWAGIAAGTGFALGLIGRVASIRNKRKHAMPTLVIVEASC